MENYNSSKWYELILKLTLKAIEVSWYGTRMHSSRMCIIHCSGHLGGEGGLLGFYPGGCLPGGYLPREVLLKGVPAQWGVCPRGVCLGVSAQGVSVPRVSAQGVSAQGVVQPPGHRILDTRLWPLQKWVMSTWKWLYLNTRCVRETLNILLNFTELIIYFQL